MRSFKILSRSIIAAILTFSKIGSCDAAGWATQEEVSLLRAELTELLQGAEMRHPGSEGNLLLEERVAQKFASAGFPHGEQKFPVPIFIPGQTQIELPDRSPITVLPLHPTLFRPGNFVNSDFSSALVYLGAGSVSDLQRLSGTQLKDTIAVMDFNCGNAWIDWLRFGIKGFIFLEPEEGYIRNEALSKIYSTEVSVPRFLVRGEEAKALKEGAKQNLIAKIKAEPSRWKNRQLRNLWVLIPGADPILSGEAAVFTAPLDANCIAPELAAGGQSAGNLFMLLRMLDSFKETPPARTVLLAAVNAHTQHYHGERLLGWHLMGNRADIENLRDTINADLRYNQAVLKHYGELQLDEVREEDRVRLIKWRSLVDDTTGRNITVKNALVNLAKRDVNRVKTDLGKLLTSRLSDAERRLRRESLNVEKEKYVNILTLFNKVGLQTELTDLSHEELEILRGYLAKTLVFNQACAELNSADLQNDLRNGEVRDVLQGRQIRFVVMLNADWSTDNYGFSIGDYTAVLRWASPWGINVADIGKRLAEEAGGKPNLMLDTLSMRGGLSESYYQAHEFSPDATPPATAIMQYYNRTPAFVFGNVFSGHAKSFLPSDTIENLDEKRFADGVVFLTNFWRELLNDRYITTSSQLGVPPTRRAVAKSIQLKTCKYDELAASVFPEIPVADSAVILRYFYDLWSVYAPSHQGRIIYGDIVNAHIAMTDMRASTIIYGLVSDPATRKFTSAAFHFDDDFIKVDHAINAGAAQNKVDSNRLNANLTVALFECQEYPLYTMYDTSLIGNMPIAVSGLMALTAKGNAAPRNFGLTGVMSPMTGKYIEPAAGAPAAYYMDGRERFKFVTNEKRAALYATAEEPEGHGILLPSEAGDDLFYRAAHDASVLNHARLTKLRDVAGELPYEFLERGDALLRQADEARSQNRHLDYLRNLYEGLGAQVKSYEQTKQTTDDMLKAVVVYMALLLPFCFFVQKLLFNFVKIEHEMGMFAVLFVFTFLVFRFIHPAFRVAQAAEAIFIAFVMGAMGLFVISILRGRFEGEMQLLFRSFQGGVMTDDDVGYSTVTQKAMLIGVNNMKRRRVRTMLTTATIVLIAFTMLSFTSISKKVNPTVVPRDKKTPYTGIMYHWPGKSTMDDNTLTAFRNLLNGRGELLERHWWVANFDNIPLRVSSSQGQEIQLEGILGLSVQEDGFVESLPLQAGRNFTSDQAREALLFASLAQVLGINESNFQEATLTVGGEELKVVGLLDDTLFRNLKDLNGLPLAPIKRIETDAGTDAFNPRASVKASPTEDIHDMGALFHVETSSLLVLPLKTSSYFGARPYSISLKTNEDESIWNLADLILTTTSARFYLASEEPFTTGEEDGSPVVAAGVYYIGSNYSTSVGGLAVLLIPLIIASTIILNTMLGSVYERKKEIAVYNAVGLNPHHIGTFFLAESFVYGVIGAVGGYLIGQLQSLLIARFDLVKGINFNYSSMSVAYVILFTIAIVLLSTLYPAVVATRAAVPSGKRKWSLPPREGNAMAVVFPFIYTPRVASGVISYVQEYFSRFTAASIGDLIATELDQRWEKDSKGRSICHLDYHVALAPYDLGVTQHLKFNLSYDEQVQAYRLTMRIERVSGQDTNWITVNRPFLERLRKYLMRWRNLDLAQQQVYVQQTEQDKLHAQQAKQSD